MEPAAISAMWLISPHDGLVEGEDSVLFALSSCFSPIEPPLSHALWDVAWRNRCKADPQKRG